MKEQRLHIKFPELSDDELYHLRDTLSVEREKIDDMWADEIGKLASEGLDHYTFSGRRMLKKVAKKYAKMGSGIAYLQELTLEEIRKRDKYKEEQKYTGKGKYKDDFNMTQEEFLEKEQIKTESYKSRIE